MRAKAFVFMFLALVLTVSFVPVYAQGIPPLPHAFYGELEVNGSAAEPGYTVEARGEGVTTGIAGNPIVTEEDGWYGSADPLGVKLIVQGDILEGATITFYVNDVAAEPTAEWHSGDTTRVYLSVDIEAPPAARGGAGVAAPPTIEVVAELFGVESIFLISEEGEILETIEATSEEGDFTLTIPDGTIALDEYGDPLESLEIDVDESPPDPPEDAHIIGLAYDLGPDGATFDPPITVEFTYDPDDLPEDLEDEADLVIAFYDEDIGEWVELVCVVDTVNNTITAEVEHFTTFVVIAPPPAPPVAPPPVLAPAAFSASSLSISPLEVDIGKTVTISILVSNTGEEEGSYTVTLKVNGVVEKTKEITLAGGASEKVTFATSKDKAGIYSVDVDGLIGSFTVKEEAAPPVAPPAEVKPEINWPVIGGVIGGVIVVGLLIFFVVRRRASD